MSQVVKERLKILGIMTTHEERVELDKEIESETGQFCDAGVNNLSDNKFRKLLDRVRKRLIKKMEVLVYA